MLVACLADVSALLAGRRRVRLAGLVPRCLLMLCPARGHAVRALAGVLGLRRAFNVVGRSRLCYAARLLLLPGPAGTLPIVRSRILQIVWFTIMHTSIMQLVPIIEAGADLQLRPPQRRQ